MNTEQTKLTHMEAWAHFKQEYSRLSREEKGRLPKGLTLDIATAQRDYLGRRQGKNKPLPLGPDRVQRILQAVAGVFPDRFRYVFHVETWVEILPNGKAASE